MNIKPDMQPVLYVLGLCPVLAVGDTVANALGIGAAAIAATTISSLAASLIGRRLPDEMRWAACVLVLAATVSCFALLLNAFFHELHRSLGLFLPLLVANFLIQLGIEESSALTPPRAVLSGLRTGGTIALLLLPLGVAREIVGHGSVLHDAGIIFGEWARVLDVQLFRADMGFLLAILPPGAFISFGMLLAARNWLEHRRLAIGAGHEQEKDR